jgi:PPE-repeat protein
MVLDFAAIPPEITSALMYAGAGAGPLMAAAAAWHNLAAELTTTATQWESIITALTTEQWTGAGSAAAAAAAQPIVSWLTTTAADAEQAGIQATASAAAYEAAFAATVPPPMIAANRSLLATLIATNFLGINTPAIMATEAHYAEMWVQDATMMYTYQAASLAAGVLTPVTPMAPATNPAAPALQGAAVAQANAAAPIQALSNAFVFGPPAINGPNPINFAGTFPISSSLLQSIDGFLGTPSVFNGINGAVNTGAWFTFAAIPNGLVMGKTLGAVPGFTPAALADSVAPAAGAVAATEGTMVGSVIPTGGLGAAASASLGQAGTVGGLSVPAGWSAATPASTVGATVAEGSGWTAAAEEAAPVAAMPGGPGMVAAGKGAGAYAGPRYGVKPIVMPKVVV